jgi:hypothetical protein
MPTLALGFWLSCSHRALVAHQACTKGQHSAQSVRGSGACAAWRHASGRACSSDLPVLQEVQLHGVQLHSPGPCFACLQCACKVRSLQEPCLACNRTKSSALSPQVKETGEVIKFVGTYAADRGQAAALVFYTFVSLAATALVLSITNPQVGRGLVRLRGAAAAMLPCVHTAVLHTSGE